MSSSIVPTAPSWLGKLVEYDKEHALDTVKMGGFDIPGRSRIRKASSPRNWQQAAGFGLDGSYATYTGAPLAEFDIEVALWRGDQFSKWEKFARNVLAKPAARDGRTLSDVEFASAVRAMFSGGVDPSYRGIGISHPLLRTAPIYIAAVLVKNVTQFDCDDDGLWTCTIECLEWRNVRPTPIRQPTASIPTHTPKAPSAKDAADVKINALVAQVGDLL